MESLAITQNSVLTNTFLCILCVYNAKFLTHSF